MLTFAGFISACGLGWLGAAGDGMGAVAAWTGLTAAGGKPGMLTFSGLIPGGRLGWLGAAGEGAGTSVLGAGVALLPTTAGAGALVLFWRACCRAFCNSCSRFVFAETLTVASGVVVLPAAVVAGVLVLFWSARCRAFCSSISRFVFAETLMVASGVSDGTAAGAGGGEVWAPSPRVVRSRTKSRFFTIVWQLLLPISYQPVRGWRQARLS
jgi:hypothetical protein